MYLGTQEPRVERKKERHVSRGSGILYKEGLKNKEKNAMYPGHPPLSFLGKGVGPRLLFLEKKESPCILGPGLYLF